MENTVNYKKCFVPIEKEVTKIDKYGNESFVTISCKMKLIDSAGFIATSLSNLVDNLIEGIHKIKCKDCNCFLEYESDKDNSIKCECLSCNKNYSNKIDQESKKQFKNTLKFSNNDVNKLILFLRKGVYRYEYIDHWENFNGTSLPIKGEFYSNLNVEDITDADYMHANRVCKDFEIKNSGEYHDLSLKSDTLLLADVFENVRKICLKFYELDPVKFLSAPGLAWQVALKKTEVKLELLTDIDMLLMIGKETRGGICHTIQFINMLINIRNYDKNKESSYLKHWEVNDLYGWEMSQRFPVNSFEWIKNTFQFNEDFIKTCNEQSDEGCFLKVNVQYFEKLHDLYNDLSFSSEKVKFKKIEKLLLIYIEKLNLLFT